MIKHSVKPKAKAKPKAACAPKTNLISTLKDMGGYKTAPLDEIHKHLAKIQACIDEAISHADGDLKKMLKAMRKFLC